MSLDNAVLIALRHGSTDLNAANRFRGNANPPLSALGLREANQAAHYLQPIDISFIVASSKQRSETTANIVSLAKAVDVDSDCPFNLKPVLNPDLFPWGVGEFSGKPKSKENLDKLQYYIDNPDIPVPGGESLSDFRYRVRPLIKEAIDIGIECGTPGLIVVHSSVIHELGILFNNDHASALVKPGGVAVVHISDGRLRAQAVFRPEYGKQHSEAS